jgi:hypothetical protein
MLLELAGDPSAMGSGASGPKGLDDDL